MKNTPIFLKEKQIEQGLRKLPFLIPAITVVTAGLLYWGIIACYQGYLAGNKWAVIVAGLLAHAFFIVLVHDGAHKAITRSKFDRLLMNLGAGLMLLPFYAEPFRKYHLLHHSNTNNELDPLWPSTKKDLYENHRLLYIFCELIPLLFTIYLITRSNKQKGSGVTKTIKAPQLSIFNMVWASAISIAIILFFKPGWAFFVLSLLSLNFFSAVRHWCEHLGYRNDRASNSFWFPLGMGIGNHDTHHQLPNISWFSLMAGLPHRPKSTNIFKTIHGVFFRKDFIHYHEGDQKIICPNPKNN
jgi:fatty acid desaturase